MDAWLKCEISVGQFDNEAAVRGQDYSGEEFSMFAPREFVQGDIGDEWSNGLLRVEVLQSNQGLSLIYLPTQSFNNGQSITVRDAQLKSDSLNLAGR